MELWSSDGTAAGTQPVAGGTHSKPTELCALGTLLLFSATSPNGVELWRSDGTAAGTFELDLNPGSAGSSPASLTALGSAVLFAATDPGVGRELWSSTGSGPGTRVLSDVYPSPASSSSPSDLLGW